MLPGAAVGLLQGRQDGHAALIIQRALRRRLHVPGGALQQARPKASLQRLNGCSRHRPGKTQIRGGGAERTPFDDAHEQGQGIQFIHGIVPAGKTILSRHAVLSSAFRGL